MKDVWMETGLTYYLLDAIVVLEHISKPSNFQIKLFLIRLYNRLGRYDIVNSVCIKS